MKFSRSNVKRILEENLDYKLDINKKYIGKVISTVFHR